MGLFTIDRTINFEEEKVKKVLNIIDNSRNDMEIEDQMLSQKIVNLREGTDTHGFFRRRWSTFLKDFELYNYPNITEIGKLYMNELLSTKEVTLLLLIKRIVEVNNTIVRPFELILKTIEELGTNNLELYISQDEFEKILSHYLTAGYESVGLIVEKINKRRNNDQTYMDVEPTEPCHYDIWKNLIVSAGVGEPNSKEIRINLELPIVKFVSKYFDDVMPRKDKDFEFNDIFVKYIQFPSLVNENSDINFVRTNYKEYYPSIVYNYLFNMSINQIETDILKANEHGNIPHKILNGMNISTNMEDSVRNIRLYAAFKGYEGIIINKLRNTTNKTYRYIADSISTYLLTGEIINDETQETLTIDKYKQFYLDIIEDLKNDSEINNRINLRNEFVKEYPIERIKTLSLKEYALGTDDFKETLSYKLEFGKYKYAGPGIGGGTAAKHGIYYRSDGKYYGRNNKLIENPNEFWIAFRNELYSFLIEVENIDDLTGIFEKYTLISSIPAVLTKLCFLYYPNKFVGFCSRNRLLGTLKYFRMNYNTNYLSPELSCVLAKQIKKLVPCVLSNDPQYIGITLWLFYDKFIANNESEDEVEEMNDFDEYTRDNFLEDVFISEDKYDSIISILEKKKNIILEGAPGVGKTFMAKRLAYSLIGSKDTNKVKLIQFHQSYSYEDFIEGFRPIENGFELKKGIFYKLCKKAENDSENNYYLIIDEINRGNLSKIFGELLMLIEADKRGEKLTLAYSEKTFSVPNNLYIIGLMNTADRSLALIDYALRRRFSFIRIEPAFDNEKFIKAFNEKFDNDFSNVINIIKRINEAIENDKSLGSGFKIGHSYFCPQLKDRKGNKKDIQDIITYEIIPLLEEYWYDDEDSLIQWKNALAGVLDD